MFDKHKHSKIEYVTLYNGRRVVVRKGEGKYKKRQHGR